VHPRGGEEGERRKNERVRELRRERGNEKDRKNLPLPAWEGDIEVPMQHTVTQS